MAYFTPYIDENGIHVPNYTDILDYYIANAKKIFGGDIYLGIDSQDYQMISIIARSAAASLQAAIDSYNTRDPDNAFGEVLDGLITINGLKRKPAGYSTVDLVLTGIPYTLIRSGVVESLSGDRWNLPQEVVLDSSGIATVTAIAQEKGAIVALGGEITSIVTPTYGWSTVNNPNAASIGQPLESDAEVKARRRESVALPSQTPIEALNAGLENIKGVTDFRVYENDTKVTDSRGIPGNSICAIVEGGITQEIAETIARKKNMGVLSYGDIITPVTNEYNTTLNIGFFRPSYIPLYISINIQPHDGYTTEVGQQIKNAVVEYVNKLTIGNTLYNSQLWEAALSVTPDLKPYFSIDPTKGILVGTESSSQSLQNIVPSFKDKFTLDPNNISIISL